MTITHALAICGFGFAIVFIVLIGLSAVLKLQSILFSKFFQDVSGK